MYSEALNQKGNQFKAKVFICSMLMIAPSILSADFGRLREEIEMLNESDAALFHVDVMDGRFVPNLSFGFPVMQVLGKYARKPLDVHMMIEEPEKYAIRFADAGADWISFHLEATPHAHRLLQQIRSTGKKAGISLNPQTSVFQIEDLLESLDFVNIMSVNPGFSGQNFIQHSLKKVRMLSELRKKSNLNFLIEVDGGVSASNANGLCKAGSDVLVAGNAVFQSESPKNAISELIRICG
jgi:ribulose-phosphate 3-epimerase